MDAGHDDARRASDWVVLNEQNMSKQEEEGTSDMERKVDLEEETANDGEKLMVLVDDCIAFRGVN